MQTGGAQPHIYPKDVAAIRCITATSVTEQKAIAEVLSNMDLEIQALQDERNKYALIKQGMMQELLTGKTRI
jgi:type I restriction enzyme S subunit